MITGCICSWDCPREPHHGIPGGAHCLLLVRGHPPDERCSSPVGWRRGGPVQLRSTCLFGSTAGWMPLPCAALKATQSVFDRDGDDWYEMMMDVFFESSAELEGGSKEGMR
ncbi:hypothetical protein C8Q74DRAFT_1255767 [Fomes fomentarius]|nr:hypothetical protein C8Q74DRAFT_1255767 [Fomes fomentarius]